MTSKTVLITGASSGIGAATAKRFGAAGAHVLLLARDEAHLASTAETVRKSGGTATCFPVDLQDTDATLEMAARVTAEIGTPDLLINNAGIGRWLPLADAPPKEAEAAMRVPYLAAYTLSYAFAPSMAARVSGGIAFITSPASYLAWPNASAYIAARRAIAGLAETLQSELKPNGVFVTLVVLGSVATAYWEHNPDSRENVPYADDRLFPTLSPEQAADVIYQGTERKKRFVVSPPIYRAVFLMNALFPNTVASHLRRASKKTRRGSD